LPRSVSYAKLASMTFKRQTDPRQLPVQLNVKVPWQLREDLTAIASEQQLSLNELVNKAIVKGLRNELSELFVRQTREAGSTK
jgi:predicted HicB family RNase H-like nuclease